MPIDLVDLAASIALLVLVAVFGFGRGAAIARLWVLMRYECVLLWALPAPFSGASPTIFKRDRNLGLDGFVAVGGSPIRLCSEEGYQCDDEVFAVQVVQGKIRAAYNYDQLVYEVRNPRSDVTACGYGYSETRTLIKVVTYPLNTMTYNGSFFDKNTIPRGILQIFGSMRRPTSWRSSGTETPCSRGRRTPTTCRCSRRAQPTPYVAQSARPGAARTVPTGVEIL